LACASGESWAIIRHPPNEPDPVPSLPFMRAMPRTYAAVRHQVFKSTQAASSPPHTDEFTPVQIEIEVVEEISRLLRACR